MQLFTRREKEQLDRKSACYICEKPLIEGEYFRAILFDQYKNMTDDPTNSSDAYAIVEFRIHEDCMHTKNPKHIGMLASLMSLKRNMLILKNGEQPPFKIVFDGHALDPQLLT